MASHRPSVPEATKRALRAETGGKCANPGCPATRTHIHHVQEWAVYQSHDGRHMVALCPTCHDAVHHGPLTIDDETILRWKAVPRVAEGRGHLYVEPAADPRLLLGSVAVTGDEGVLIFAPSPRNRLGFSVVDEDVVLVSVVVTDRRGEDVARMVDGHMRVNADAGVRYEHVPGHHTITAPLHGRFLPEWAISRVRANEPDFVPAETVTLLDLEVVAPGLVRVQGVWLEDTFGTIITERLLHFVEMTPERPRSLAIRGDGITSVLRYTGPLTEALFNFVSADDASAEGAVRLGSSPTI